MNMVAGKHGNEKFRPGVLALTNTVASDNDMFMCMQLLWRSKTHVKESALVSLVNAFLLKG
jgi:hypothetical protein